MSQPVPPSCPPLGAPVFIDRPGDAPRAAGAYLLVLDLTRPCRVESARFGAARLAPGRYLYAGSAHGPGGLRARILRHARRDKTPHWHVDRLTRRARLTSVLIWPGGGECALAAAALRIAGAHCPIPGFGASDCPRCASHLIALPAGAPLPDAAAFLDGC